LRVKRGKLDLVALAKAVQTDPMVDVEFRLPRSARDELDRRAAENGLKRATLVRTIVLRDLRTNRESAT